MRNANTSEIIVRRIYDLVRTMKFPATNLPCKLVDPLVSYTGRLPAAAFRVTEHPAEEYRVSAWPSIHIEYSAGRLRRTGHRRVTLRIAAHEESAHASPPPKFFSTLANP